MMLNSVSDFAQLVTRYRRQRSLSQGQLAQAARLSRTYVYHLETGQRAHPSPHVVQNIARALQLQGEERNRLYAAYTTLTGLPLDEEQLESNLLDLGELAVLLVHNTSYPAHSLDRLWFFHSWNDALVTLFDIEQDIAGSGKLHLLEMVFNPRLRKRFHGWEELARRLVNDFQYGTRTLTHFPEYRALWKSLREIPEFRRISSASYPAGKPAPSFVFHVQHSELGRLALRTATTVFTAGSSHSMVSYVPGDQQTLAIYRQHGWQPR